MYHKMSGTNVNFNNAIKWNIETRDVTRKESHQEVLACQYIWPDFVLYYICPCKHCCLLTMWNNYWFSIVNISTCVYSVWCRCTNMHASICRDKYKELFFGYRCMRQKGDYTGHLPKLFFNYTSTYLSLHLHPSLFFISYIPHLENFPCFTSKRRVICLYLFLPHFCPIMQFVLITCM